MPSMLQLLLAGALIGIALILIGARLRGHSRRETPQGLRLRKRVLLLLAGAAGVIVLQLVLFEARQPSPLTELGSASYERAFVLDARRYREIEGGMERAVSALERAGFLRDEDRVLGPDEERLLLDTWVGLGDQAIALDAVRVFHEDYWRFDVSRMQRDRHVRSFLLTFAAEAALLEKAARFSALVRANASAHKFLDAPHPDHGLPEQSFSHFRQEFLGARDQARVAAGEAYLRWLDTAFDARRDAEATDAAWLWDRLAVHLESLERFPKFTRAKTMVRADAQGLRRGVRRTWLPVQAHVAEWMGDAKTRRIGEYLITPAQLDTLAAELEPGDVMVSRKNWYLSNVGLPGFWPHAMLALGTPEEFEAYFDTPEVDAWVASLPDADPADRGLAAYLRRRHPSRWKAYGGGLVEHGEQQPYRLAEAISEGVVFNTLEHAAGDYLAVLRPRVDRVEKAKTMVAAFTYIDLPYDFDFDFATAHALVCTEFVWRSWRPADGKLGLQLPLVTTAGRRCLPANEIVRHFSENRDRGDAQLGFVHFLDGREKQGRAEVCDEEAFAASWQRPKWDILQE
jgi:hypothetical protein